MKRGKLDTYSIFYGISITIGLVLFMLASSSISNINKNFLKSEPSKNKVIQFEGEKDIQIKEILDELNKNKLTTCLAYYDFDKNHILKTIVQFDGNDMSEDMSYGEFFTKEEFKNSDKSEGIYAVNLADKDEVSISNQKISKRGKTYVPNGEIIIPEKLFYKNSKEEDLKLNNRGYLVTIHGNEKEIENGVKGLEKLINNKYKGTIMEVDGAVSDVNGEETRLFKNLVFAVIVIVTLNLIGTSYLLIENRKKDLVIRKVCGATDEAIFKLYFKYLFKTTMISFLISIVIQFIIIKITGGTIGDIDIRFTSNTILYSFLICIAFIIINILPVYSKLTKIDLVELLKEV